MDWTVLASMEVIEPNERLTKPLRPSRGIDAPQTDRHFRNMSEL